MTDLARMPRSPAAPSTASLLVLLLLAGTSVHSQQAPAGAAAAQQLRTVRASECRSQSIVQDIIFSGCSTIDSPSAGQPWCLLPKAVATDPDVQALCVPDSIPARNARSSDTGETVPCDASTAPPGKQGLVFGCFTTVQAGGQLRCNSGASGLQPCRVNSARGPEGNAANETTSAASQESFFSGTILGIPKVAVFGLVGFNVLLIPAAILYFRRRKAARKGGEKKRVNLEDPTPGYKEMPSAPQSPAGPGSPAGPLGGGGGGGGGGGLSVPAQVAVGGGALSQRTSSQFGAGSRMSFAHGPSSPVPPMPAPANIEGSLGKYMVTSTYTPTLDDEIVIEPGDIVEIFQEFDDGWCSAVNISRGMTRGVFPMHCIDEDSRIDD